MNNSVNINPDYLRVVREILHSHLTDKATVWVFGSRVTGKAKKISDLDLVIDMGQPVAFELMAKLTDEFEESSLPFKVDIVDWAVISNDFRRLIENERVVIFPSLK